jgi:hypothetical protein
LNNGNGAELATLEATYCDCGYVFRHFEDCRVACMRWQAGREVCECVTLSDGSGLLIERFELLAWASTSEQLIEKLSC